MPLKDEYSPRSHHIALVLTFIVAMITVFRDLTDADKLLHPKPDRSKRSVVPIQVALGGVASTFGE